MNLWRTIAMARKELTHILRDTRSLAIVVLMPVTLMLLFGYGVNLDQKQTPIYVYDQEVSQRSQDLLKRFQSNPYFHVLRAVDNFVEAGRALDSGKAKMVVVVPWNFSRQLAQGGKAQVQVLLDASDDNTANVLMGYTQAVVQAYGAGVQLDWLRSRGVAATGAPIAIATRTWYNEDLESSAFIIPGVLALVMSVIGAFLTSLTIAREWERGTMEQLISTPVSAMEILVGKLAPYFVLGAIDVAICVVIAIGWFQVPFRGSYVVLAMSSALFLVVVLALGFLISVIAKSQFAASQLALLTTFLPAFLLSGFLFAIDQMPPALALLTRVVPARYYVSILKAIFLKGLPLTMLVSDLIPLSAFAVLLALVATRAFHKRLD